MQRVERWLIRIAVPGSLAAAIAIGLLLATPKPLPAAALGSRWILVALRTLALFYGFLLIFVPLVRSFRGDLPIELSLRGARYEEAAAASDALDALAAQVVSIEERTDELSELLADAVEVFASGTGVSPAVVAHTENQQTET